MKYIFLPALVLFSFLSFSQKNFTILQPNPEQIEVRFKSEQKNFIYKTIENQNYIDFSQMYKNLTMEEGAPAMPVFGETFIIPLTGASDLIIENASYTDIENVSVLPSKGNLKRNVHPSDIPYIFGSTYQSNEFFPSNPVALVKPFIYRTVRGQVARVFPFQYNPVTKTLRVYSSITFKIKNKPATQGINELGIVSSLPSDLHAIRYLVSNPSLDKYTAVNEDGEMLIISPDEYLSSVQELINWKNKKGIKTTSIGLSVTGSSETDIKNYIQDYYSNRPNLKYILLVGDSDKIPAHSYGSTWSEELYSDSYYGQLIGDDLYPEVFVGRLSGNATDVELMVERILEYETSPASGDWMTRAIGLASGEGAGYGDEDQADWQHMRGLRDEMLSYGYSQVYEFYDGSRGQDDADGSPSSSTILTAVNSGVGIFNYTGHGDLNTCITGNFSSANINQASNHGMYPFVVSVACNNGTFVGANCLAETWLKAKENETPTGAIAVCASTILMAWAPPMETQDEMTLINTRAYNDNEKATLGGLFYNGQMSMLEQYDTAGEEVMQTWAFFGDPSVELRNKLTQELTVEHVVQIDPNTDLSELFESVTDGAVVSLSVNNEFVSKGTINAGASSIFIPSQLPNTVIDVVATKQNYKPYTGQIYVKTFASVAENDLLSFVLYPNPVKDQVVVHGKENGPVTVSIVDCTGKQLDRRNFTSSETFTLPTGNLAKGMYQLIIQFDSKTQVERFVKE